MKGSPDKRSQEEESLVCVAPSESFLNGVRWQRRVRLGRSCHLVTHESECFHDQVKLSDSNSAVDLENRQHNEFFPSHSPRHLHWLRLSGKIKKKIWRACVQIHLDPSPECTLTVSQAGACSGTWELLRILQTPAIMLCSWSAAIKSPPVSAQVSGKIGLI